MFKLSNIAMRIKYFYLRVTQQAPEHQLILELAPQIDSILCPGLSDTLADNLAIVVAARAKHYDDIPEKLVRDIKIVREQVAEMVEIDPYLCAVDEENNKIARRLAPLYKRDGIAPGRWFNVACSFEQKMTKMLEPFAGTQPITAPVGSVKNLRVQYSKPEPTEIVRSLTTNEPLEGVSGGRMSIGVTDCPVEARVRLFESNIADSLFDESTYHVAGKAEVCDEVDSVLLQELTTEYFLGVYETLLKTAGEPIDIETSEHGTLATTMNRQSNIIAQRTRRGAGNWAIVSPATLTMLHCTTHGAFERAPITNSFDVTSLLKFVGTLNGHIKIYCHTYLADDAPILMGYKGNLVSDVPFICLVSKAKIICPFFLF